MFKTASKKIAAVALAATCALTMTLSAGTAEARNRDALIIGGALLGGALLGGLVASGHHSRYAYDDVDYVPVRRCWRERQLVGYDSWGDPIVRRVRVCNR